MFGLIGTGVSHSLARLGTSLAIGTTHLQLHWVDPLHSVESVDSLARLILVRLATEAISIWG